MFIELNLNASGASRTASRALIQNWRESLSNSLEFPLPPLAVLKAMEMAANTEEKLPILSNGVMMEIRIGPVKAAAVYMNWLKQLRS
jgi:hypothetical protein